MPNFNANLLVKNEWKKNENIVKYKNLFSHIDIKEK